MATEETIENLPIAGCGYLDAPTSKHGETIHLRQVRYVIRRHFKEMNGRMFTMFYIFDKHKNEIPVWAENVFIERHYAVGTLQEYLLGLNGRSIYELIIEAEQSPLTFTERNKACLKYPTTV